MGKQLAFYMVDRDEDEFLEFVHATGDVLIVPETTDREGGEEFSTFRELEGRRLGEGCHLWNRSISPKPIVEYYDAHGGCFCLDFSQSEVVNVWRSKRVGRTLSKGRLHIENVLLRPDGSMVEKSSEFVKWFDRLCRWIRKEYPHRFERAFLSARAEALSKTGVELCGYSF